MNTMHEIIFGIIESVIILILYTTIINKKEYIKDNKLKVLIFVFTYTVFSYWITAFLPLGYHTVVLTLFVIITLSTITKTNIMISSIAVIFSTIFFIIVEYLFLMIISGIFNINISDIMNSEVNRLFFAFLIKPTEIVLSVLLYKKFRNPFLKNESNSTKNIFINYIIIGCYFISIYIVSLNYISNPSQNLIKHEILFLLIFIVCIFWGILDYKQKIDDLRKDHQIKLQKDHIDSLEAIINIIRREKHDFSNHISTIYAMCSLNKPDTVDRIKDYLQTLSYNLKSSYNLFHSGNYYVDGLLAVKSNYAFEHEIDFDVDFEQPLSYIDIDDNDLIRIMSNIIDNAFQALKSGEHLGNRIVSIYTYIENGTFYLAIANNGPKIPTNVIKKIFNNGFTTKSKDKEHGLGLNIVKYIISKNNGEISVISSEEETLFLISFSLGNEAIKGVS